MPRNVSTPKACINKYIADSRKSSKIETYEQYRTVLTKITNDLENASLESSPYNIGQREIRFLLDVQWKDLEVSTRKWNTHILSRYLRFFGNNIIGDLDLRWPQDMRPNVDWLTDDEQYKLITAPKTPLEAIVIHLELNLGLRAAEVCNLRLDSINYRRRVVDVLGKGHGEGKWRSVPFAIDTEDILSRWMEERNSIVKRVKAYKPSWEDPGTLLLWCHYPNKPQAGAYSDRGHSLDRAVIFKVRSRLNMDFTNHTLRRTFGRTMFHAGAELVSIAKILGHDDTTTTIDYLGVNMDDMQSAMDLHADYQRKMLIRMRNSRGVQNE